MPKVKEVKTILNKTKRRDSWFLDDYTLNLYSSCSFNCLFCYIRGSKYGTNLAESLTVKSNAIELLDRQLSVRAKKQQYGFIVLSSATDPYLKMDQNYQLTRQALEMILKYKFPVHIITRSNGIERDFDLLQAIDKEAILPPDLAPVLRQGALVSFSFSTLENDVARIFEPGATPPDLRLTAVKASLDANLHTGISLMPLIPFISDTTESLEALFSTFAGLEVDYILPAGLTLFGSEKADSKTLMLNAIAKHYPHLEEKYRRFFAHVSEMPAYYKKAFAQKMDEMCSKFGLKNRIV